MNIYENKKNDDKENEKELSINKKDFEIRSCCCKKYIIKILPLYDININSRYKRR